MFGRFGGVRWSCITLRIVDAQSRVAGAGMAISQWIFTGRPAAPPVPSGSGSSRAAGALRGLQPVVLGYGSKSCPYGM